MGTECKDVVESKHAVVSKRTSDEQACHKTRVCTSELCGLEEEKQGKKVKLTSSLTVGCSVTAMAFSGVGGPKRHTC